MSTTLTDICEVTRVHGMNAEPSGPPGLLIELPHGATLETHYRAIERRMRGALPDDLVRFFFVNTDVGSPECARQLASMLPGGALIVRSLLPRTLVDCNRMLAPFDEGTAGRTFTPPIPDYVRDPADVALLEDLYRRYQAEADRAYERVLGAGGRALILHTYAPRSISIERLDDDIVTTLRRAYEPERYARWPRRPDVDVISRADDGTLLTSDGIAGSIREAFACVGIDAAENATYRQHPETMGYLRSRRWHPRVVCVELNRELLADPFTPFEEMTVRPDRARRMAAPLARALSAWAD